jgi:hypothetical protein
METAMAREFTSRRRTNHCGNIILVVIILFEAAKQGATGQRGALT